MTESESPSTGTAADPGRRLERYARAVKRRELRVAKAKFDAHGQLSPGDEAALEGLAGSLVDRLVRALGGRFPSDELGRGGDRLLDPERD